MTNKTTIKKKKALSTEHNIIIAMSEQEHLKKPFCSLRGLCNDKHRLLGRAVSILEQAGRMEDADNLYYQAHGQETFDDTASVINNYLRLGY